MAETLVVQGGEVGEVKVGDTVLPGEFQRLSVSGAVEMDEARVAGRSGTTKQPLGFGDATVELTLLLANDETGTVLEKLKVISGVFQAQDRFARPFVYTVANEHLAARGIRQVVFKGLKSDEDNQSDLIACSLEFTEHRPITLKAEKRRPKTQVVAPDTYAVPDDGQGVLPAVLDFEESGANRKFNEAASLRPGDDDTVEGG